MPASIPPRPVRPPGRTFKLGTQRISGACWCSFRRMPDRATYLARLLTTRLIDLRRATSEDDERAPAHIAPRDVVAKILAVEEGVIDQVTVERITAAAPGFAAVQSVSDRDIAVFAEQLRRELKL